MIAAGEKSNASGAFFRGARAAGALRLPLSRILRAKQPILIVILAAGICLPVGSRTEPTESPEIRTVRFLAREVPAWSKNNGCFSCHNNGDAARALYAAARRGIRVPADALAETTAWLRQPLRWKQNKGDPGFSDKRLADVQFATALLEAFETGHLRERRPLEAAARLLAAEQSGAGAWDIEAGNSIGSPATYGAPLATALALKTLRKAALPETEAMLRRAENWLRKAPVTNVPAAAALLLASAETTKRDLRQREDECLQFLLAAQTRGGGWGPYSDAPPEAYDTALALLALAKARQKSRAAESLRRGRRFLISLQNADGSWPATTRPPDGDSYAQTLSTTGWAALALLETRTKGS